LRQDGTAEGMARPRFAQTATALTIVILFLFMASSSFVTSPSFEDIGEDSPTSARQGSLDVDCTGYKFEDLFDYNFASLISSLATIGPRPK